MRARVPAVAAARPTRRRRRPRPRRARNPWNEARRRNSRRKSRRRVPPRRRAATRRLHGAQSVPLRPDGRHARCRPVRHAVRRRLWRRPRRWRRHAGIAPAGSADRRRGLPCRSAVPRLERRAGPVGRPGLCLRGHAGDDRGADGAFGARAASGGQRVGGATRHHRGRLHDIRVPAVRHPDGLQQGRPRQAARPRDAGDARLFLRSSFPATPAAASRTRSRR